MNIHTVVCSLKSKRIRNKFYDQALLATNLSITVIITRMGVAQIVCTSAQAAAAVSVGSTTIGLVGCDKSQGDSGGLTRSQPPQPMTTEQQLEFDEILTYHNSIDSPQCASDGEQVRLELVNC